MGDHGSLHPMIAKKERYIPVNVYNKMKEIFIKNWKDSSLLVLYSSDDIPNLNNHEISDIHIKCEICTRQL